MASKFIAILPAGTNGTWLGDELPGEEFEIENMDKTPIEELTAQISTYGYSPAAPACEFTDISPTEANAFVEIVPED